MGKRTWTSKVMAVVWPFGRKTMEPPERVADGSGPFERIRPEEVAGLKPRRIHGMPRPRRTLRLDGDQAAPAVPAACRRTWQRLGRHTERLPALAPFESAPTASAWDPTRMMLDDDVPTFKEHQAHLEPTAPEKPRPTEVPIEFPWLIPNNHQ